MDTLSPCSVCFSLLRSKDVWSIYVSKLERAVAAGLTGFILCSLIHSSIQSTNAY